MKYLFTPFLLFLIFLTSCNYSDSSEELSGNYYYSSEGKNSKEIYSHDANGNHIFSKVIDFAHNDDFIIVLQKPHWENHKSSLGFFLRNDLKKYPTNSIEEIIRSEFVADSMLKNDPYYRKVFSNSENYWIIAHKEDKVLGPFDREEFFKKRIELEIPDTLKLKSKD